MTTGKPPLFSSAKYQAHETWYSRDGRPFHPGIHYCAGGNTKVYGAALFRLRKEDFGEIKHHGGAWPLAYEDFEPYYSEAEHFYHVHGEHGVDPTDPPGQPSISPSTGFP